MGPGQSSGNEGTQWQGAHHMHVSGTAETVDWCWESLLHSQHENQQTGGKLRERNNAACYIYGLTMVLGKCFSVVP